MKVSVIRMKFVAEVALVIRRYTRMLFDGGRHSDCALSLGVGSVVLVHSVRLNYSIAAIIKLLL